MAERILVVGGGAREHALVWKLARSRRAAALFAAPGNPGIAATAETVPVAVTDIDGLVAAAQRLRIDLVVVGPEVPLALGLADQLRAAGFRVCGASQAAARIESSKVWSKRLMTEAGVPTARAAIVTDLATALMALTDFDLPVVIKADGLAAGKGVVVASTRDEARMTLTSFLEDGALGAAGRTALIEECLVGREVSVIALTDGTTVLPLPPACDYKRAGDDDRGPNTGGMGAYAPVPVVDAALLDRIRVDVLEPTVRALAERDAPLRGVLYAGLMLAADGPRTLEFNARFGDPEAQVILPLLDGDLVELLAAVADGTLAKVSPPPTPAEAAVGVVLAAAGYPGPVQAGAPLSGLDAVPDDLLVFQAGTRRDTTGALVTAGGRVLTVVGRGATLAAARDRAYAGVEAITFPGRQYRTDIARRETSWAHRPGRIRCP